MRRIDAQAIPTQVIYLESGRDWSPVRQFPRDAMAWHLALTDAELRVSAANQRWRYPHPAAVRAVLVDLGPKAARHLSLHPFGFVAAA